jgi:hypothetical protein
MVTSIATGQTTPVLRILPGQTATINRGGYVWWYNSVETDSLDVVFDDPTAAADDQNAFPSGTGNIPLTPGGDWTLEKNFYDPTPFLASRQFLRAGTFVWHSPHTGLSGTVIVQ